jgi:hypothetical protein
MRRRAEAARATLVRHPWAIGLLDSRSRAGPPTLRHHDAMIGCLRAAGFSVAMTAHAYAVLDSYIYGFALQEVSLPFTKPEETVGLAQSMLRSFPADAFPHLIEFTVEHVLQPGYDFGDEFAFGLELILDGLERVRETA